MSSTVGQDTTLAGLSAHAGLSSDLSQNKRPLHWSPSSKLAQSASFWQAHTSVPPAQVPAAQTSVAVQALPSSQGASSMRATATQPRLAWQVLARQGLPRTGQSAVVEQPTSAGGARGTSTAGASASRSATAAASVAASWTPSSGASVSGPPATGSASPQAAATTTASATASQRTGPAREGTKDINGSGAARGSAENGGWPGAGVALEQMWLEGGNSKTSRARPPPPGPVSLDGRARLPGPSAVTTLGVKELP